MNPAYDVKIDHNFSAKSRIYSRFSHAKRRGSTPRFYGNDADDVGEGNTNLNNLVLEDVYTLGPTTI